eukprot:TRINITY_DN74459_c0_g1_i1.p1 TRINITY_DN74459_c0_g1~~TRINITY_DN74459_c0_g1_i1.p1  ORF type:complete len:122 (-),score=20.19 TRINITY_DN74459_c0_g1_i1:99-464(-)
MSYASGARWARCRSAHLSSWSRAVNTNFRLHSRGLASAAVLRVAAEARPPTGFVEQRVCASSVMTGDTQLSGSEDSDDIESLEVVAALIDSVIAASELSVGCGSNQGICVASFAQSSISRL